MKKNFFVFLVFIMSLASVASAHVKWFVDSEKVIGEDHGRVPFYYLGSSEVWVWALISIFIVVMFSIIDRVIPEPQRLRKFGNIHRHTIVRVSEVVLGLFLVTVSFVWHIILVPEMPIDSLERLHIGFVQIVAGLLFIFGFLPRVAAVLAGLIYLFMGMTLGLMPILENIMLLALLVFFYLEHVPVRSYCARYRKYGLEIVRIGTGISLIVFAFTEKLMYPELGIEFLRVHNWNFMYNMGIGWFSDNLFVLSTGFAELVFGIIFIFGYLTRINTIAISCFFAVSVVTMAVSFGQWEVEDLVVYSAAVLFIFYGHGETKFFHKIREDHPLRRITLHHIWKRIRG